MKKGIFILCMAFVSFGLSAQSDFDPREAMKSIRTCFSESDNCSALEDSLLKVASVELEASDENKFLLKLSYTHIQFADYPGARRVIEQARSVAEESGISILIAETHRYSALLEYYEGQLDSALSSLSAAVRFFSDERDSLKMGQVYTFRGQILRERGYYSQALEEYLVALDLFDQMSDDVNKANVLGEMATLYAMSGENNKAIEYGRKAAGVFQSIPDKEHSFAYVSLNLANNLNYAEKPDSAILILDEVIPIFESEGDLYLLMNAKAQLGRAYYKKGEIAKALSILEESNAMDPENQYVAQSRYNYHLMGRMYSDIDAWPSALAYMRKSYRLHQQTGLNDELKSLLEDMAVAFENLGQNDSALKYLRAYQEVSDSLYTIEEKNRLNELKAQYETDLKEEQLRNKTKEIELLERSNEIKTQRNINLAIILVVVLALTIAIISRQRNSIRLNKLLTDQKQKAHDAELQAREAERLQLEEDLKRRQGELANQALLIAEKNELLRSFRNEVEKAGEKDESSNASLRSISRKMERAENQQGDWDKFMQLFRDVHPELLSQLAQASADLTHNELRLLALMKMGFSNKEIADILHVTEGGLKKARYRLRKKLNLEAQANLHQYIQNI